MKAKTTVAVTDFFKPSEYTSISGVDFTDKVLILNPTEMLPQFRTRANLLWRAHGGFGCSPTAAGRAVMAECVGDGEEARWDRHQFVGVFTGDVAAEGGAK